MDAKTVLSRDEFIEAFRRPQWRPFALSDGRSVGVRVLSVGERSAWERRSVKNDDLRSSYLALVLVDGEGNRLFTDDEADKIGALVGVDLDQLFWDAMAYNRMTADDLAEMRKNSKTQPSA